MEGDARFLNLVTALRFGANREGVIGGQKSIQAAVRILQHKYPERLGYDWDLFLWGDNSSELFAEILRLIPNPIMGYLQENDGEPVHHSYCWEGEESVFRGSLESLWTDAEYSQENKEDFLLDAIVWFTYVPTSLRICKALSLSQKKNTQRPGAFSCVAEFPAEYRGKTFASREAMAGLLSTYAIQGMSVAEIAGEFHITIPKERVAVYGYLEPFWSAPPFRIDSLDVDPFALSGLIGQLRDEERIDLPQKLRQRLEDTYDEEFGRESIEGLRRAWREELDSLGKLCESTETAPLGLLYEGDGLRLRLSPELVDEISEKTQYSVSDACLNFYHLLQPLEYMVLTEARVR